MKKTDTIALYVDEYLAGRSEERRQAFYEKDEDHQYAAVMAWKRRRELKNNNDAAVPNDGGQSVSAILRSIQSVTKLISSFEMLPEKDRQRLIDAIDLLKTEVADFDTIKAKKELERLEEDRKQLEERIAILRSKAYGNPT